MTGSTDSPPAREPERRSSFRAVLVGLALGAVLGWLAVAAFELFSGATADGSAATSEIPDAIEAALAQPDPLGRAEGVARVLAAALDAAQDPRLPEALQPIFEAARIPDGDIEVAVFVAWWARADPVAAHAWTRSHPRGESIRVLVALAEQWGARSPLEAIRAVVAEPFESRRQNGLAAALRGAARSETLIEAGAPARIDWSAMLGSIEDRALRRDALVSLFTWRISREGVASALSWMAGFDEGDAALADDVRSAAAISIASTDPDLAIEVLDPLMEAARLPPPGVVPRVAAESVRLDPRRAIEWLAKWPPNLESRTALRDAYNHWITRDRNAALAWARTRAETPESWFDPIRAIYGYRLGFIDDPAEGLRILFLLPIDEERAFYVPLVYSKWKRDAPEAAEAWLAAADLPESRKDELRALPPWSPGPNLKWREGPKSTSAQERSADQGGPP